MQNEEELKIIDRIGVAATATFWWLFFVLGMVFLVKAVLDFLTR